MVKKNLAKIKKFMFLHAWQAEKLTLTGDEGNFWLVVMSVVSFI